MPDSKNVILYILAFNVTSPAHFSKKLEGLVVLRKRTETKFSRGDHLFAFQGHPLRTWLFFQHWHPEIIVETMQHCTISTRPHLLTVAIWASSRFGYCNKEKLN
jgi:hypothetical protein